LLITKECKEIRRNILKISKVSGHGHLPSCFSIVEMLYTIYSVMNHDPDDPSWESRDIFILSKGHGSLAYYCVLAYYGYFKIDEVFSFGSFNSNFGCHIDRFKVPGSEASTGSLGHGIGLAVGSALGLKIKKSNRRVFVLIGDGESNEGSVWEAVMIASNLKLSNLTIIYDNNLSHSRGLQIYNPAERFKAFGCETSEVDGHDMSVLKRELINRGAHPKVIVANTEKGYGCRSFVDNQYVWHRKSPNDDELGILLKELDEETV
jgi:transketolase